MTMQVASGENKKLSDGNEIQILQFLIESISAILDSFGASLKDLETRLAGGIYTPGGNAWAAAHVSLGEQRVLGMARKKAEKLLAAVESEHDSLPILTQCANCGKDSEQLMFCSRCRAIKYCGRACQVAHFKEHKAACQTMAAKNGPK